MISVSIKAQFAVNSGVTRVFEVISFFQAHSFAVQRGLVRKSVERVMAHCLIVRAETLLRDNQWSTQQICGALNHKDGTKVSY